MKYCVECGKRLRTEAKFCNGCGATQPEVDETVSEDVLVEEHDYENKPAERKRVRKTIVKQNIEDEEDEEENTNQTLDKLSHHSKNYFTYLNRNTVFPKIADRNDAGFLGLVNFALMTLFTALGISHSISAGVRSIFGEMFPLDYMYSGGGNSFGEYNSLTRAFPFAFQLIFFFAVFYFTFMLTPFLYQLLFSPTRIGFLKSFNMIFSPASAGVYVSAGAFLLSFVLSPASPIIVIGLLVPMFLLCISYLGSLWLTDIRIKNRFYVIAGTIIVGLIITIVLVTIGMNIIFSSMY